MPDLTPRDDTGLGSNSDSGLPEYRRPQTRGQQRRQALRSRKALGAYAVALVALAIIAYAFWPAPPKPSLCGGQLVPVSASGNVNCIGLSDGTVSFSRTDPFLALEHKIAAENRRAAAHAQRNGIPWVAVAYLIPMTLNSDSAITLEGVKEEIAGAYTAQWESNHRSQYGDSPQVKLYLVNEGPTEGQWQTAVKQIKAGTSAKLRIVAVAGLGDSLAETKDAAHQMSDASLAMFGTALTANDLDSLHYPGLVRVAPNDTNEVQAALDYLPRLPGGGATAALVRDTAIGDDYVNDWAQQVQHLYPQKGHAFITPPVLFNRSFGGEESLMTSQAQQICTEHPNVVFFAGRARDLEKFVGAFDGTDGPGCDKPIAIISGDDDLIDEQTDGKTEYSSFLSALKPGNISLYSTELQGAQEWSACGTVPASQMGSAARFKEFQGDFGKLLGHLPISGGDTNALLARDAVITAVSAIRHTTDQAASVSQNPYNYSGHDPKDIYTTVTQNLSLLFNHPVNGVSGVIKIDSTTGDTVGKPLTVVQHLANNGALSCKAIETP